MVSAVRLEQVILSMIRLCTLASVTLCLLCGTSLAAEIRRLVVSPPVVQLDAFNQTQQLLVTANTTAGKKLDVTHSCQLTVTGSNVAELSGSKVIGIANGNAALIVKFGGQQTRIPIRVDSLSESSPIHFVNDVMPILSKNGCNSGGCHGKASGQNGFKLSVFGFDPEADFVALSKESRGRRVFPGVPEKSLLALKATNRSPHGGGRRIEPGSTDDKLLSEWIRQGIPWGSDSAPTLKSITVEPVDRVVGRQSQQQLLVTATYSDGSKRDVTDRAAFTSNSTLVADVDPGGLVHTGSVPGEAAITINYMGQVAAARILIPLEATDFAWDRLPVNNAIDSYVWAKLERMGIAPSDQCDDSTFIRRVFIDTIGTLPKPMEVREFLSDSRADKRNRLIDRVLSRKEYADYWALKWADTLLVDRKSLGERGAFEFHQWLRKQMELNRPYDQWVRELVTATGISGKYGPVNFYRALRKPEDAAKGISQAFLGIRMDCAQCHHHPFEKWGQEDFYGMSGIFGGLQFQKLADDRELIFHAGYREARIPLTNELVPVRPPGGSVVDAASSDPRLHLANWMTAGDNPWFARLLANRLWAQFFSRGLVEPVDDLRSTNPAVNEPLLNHLTNLTVGTGFDQKAVMRQILMSRVYQLSSTPTNSNIRDEQNFSHHISKRLPAEVLLDAICEVTGVPEVFAGLPVGTRSIEAWDNRLPSYFLDTFGRSERQSPCECGKSGDPTMSQALHLMNAPEIEAKITSPIGRAAKLSRSSQSNTAILEEICLAAIGRMPSRKEVTAAQRLFETGTRQAAVQDVMWMVLNSYDFLFVK